MCTQCKHLSIWKIYLIYASRVFDIYCRCISRPRTESAFWMGRAKCLLEGFLKGNFEIVNSFSISHFRKGIILSDVRSWDCGDLDTALFQAV